MNLNTIELLTNIKQDTLTTVSLAKILFIFYIINMLSYNSPLLSKQMTSHIESSRITQHLIGIICVILLISEFGNIKDMKLTLLYSFMIYFWFILSTKLDIHFNLIIIAMLFIAYIYESEIDVKQLNLIVSKNKVLSDEELNLIANKNISIKKLMVVVIFSFTLIGTILYNNKKNIQYGGGYSSLKYLFG